MNPNLERALLLFQQSRHDLAEAELRQALAAEPRDAWAHALLALCLAEREQFKDATEEARQAIHLAPDFPFAHYAHARVLADRNHFKEARAAIEEAIRLDSTDADFFSVLAAIQFNEKRWADALSAAEQGLQFDPEHIGCTNLRAMAMVKLGRRAEAGATIDAALAKNPDNSATHANQGWTLLEQGDPKKALEHFRESMRLDPTNDWARHGIVEALKARNILYAGMLKYFLFMSRLSSRTQWMIVIGGVLGIRLLGGLADSNPALAPVIWPVRILYVVFVLLTWLADPLFNLMLRVNRYGRYALSREQTVASNWVGACLLLALAGLAGCLWFGANSPCLIGAMVFGFLLLPLAGTFKCRKGWPRLVMATITGVIAAIGFTTFAVFVRLQTIPVAEANLRLDSALGLVGFFCISAMLSTWAANVLAMQRPRR